MSLFSMLSLQTQPADFQMGGHHFHDEVELYYLVSGERSYLVKDRIVPIAQGGLIFINSRVLHKTVPSGDLPHTRILMNFKPACFKRWQSILPSTDFSPLLTRSFFYLKPEDVQKEQIETVLSAVLNAWEQAETALAELKTMELMLLLLRSLKNGGGSVAEIRPAGAKLQRVEQITQYIAQRSGRVTLDELSGHFYLSRFYLCRLFKQASGMTLTDYIHSVRVLRAQALLQNSPGSMTDIAEQAGFDSLSQFERVFKALMGIAPRAYRMRMRAINDE